MALEGEIVKRPPSGMVKAVQAEQEDPDVVELGRKERRGRPPEMTVDVVRKLVAAFNNEYNITQACQYAGISRPMYYDWLGKDDQFSYKMSEAQSAVNRKAKEVIVDAIAKGDINTAKWYLNARDPDFSAKLNDPEANPADKKLEESIIGYLNDTNDGAYPSLDGDGVDDVSSEPTAAAESPDRGEDTPAATPVQE